MDNCKILVVGFGNMASALVDGWLKAGIKPEQITAVGTGGKSKVLAVERDIVYVTDLSEVINKKFDLTLLAVKPQMFDAVLPLYRDMNLGTVISVAAGVSTQNIQSLLGEIPIIRSMPNLAVSVGKGVVACYSSNLVDSLCKKFITELMHKCGEVVWLEDEEQMHAVTAISGSGIAYGFYLMESLSKAGQKEGLSQGLADKLAVCAIAGAGSMAENSLLCPTNLRKQVTSPGGTTETAINSLNDNGCDVVLQRAVAQSARKSEDLSLK